MTHELRLTDVSAPASASSASGCGCGGGGACACGHHGAAHHGRGTARALPAQTFEVAGMTCAHCVSSVTEELQALGGVDRVEVDLVPGAASTVSVTAERALTRDEIRAAVEDAGYTLAR